MQCASPSSTKPPVCPADIVIDINVEEHGFGVTPDIPAIALAYVQVVREVNGESFSVFEGAGKLTFINLQKADSYGVAKALRSMRPGEKAKVYAFQTEEELHMYQAKKQQESDYGEAERYDYFLSHVSFLEWVRVEDIQIDSERFVWKATLEDGAASSDHSFPRFGDTVSVNVKSEERNAPSVERTSTFTLGDKSHEFILERFVHTMCTGETAKFLSYSVDPAEIAPEIVWTVTLKLHQAVEISNFSNEELQNFVISHKEAGNSFIHEDNLIEADILYSRGLDLIELRCGEDALNQDREIIKLVTDLCNNLSLIYLKRHQWSAVVDFTNKSILRCPEPGLNQKAYVRRAEAFMQMRQYTEAIENLRSVCSEAPQNTYAVEMLQNAQKKLSDRKQKAKRLYEESLENPRRTGWVKTWNTEKRFGFLKIEGDDRDYFFHSGEVRVRKTPVRLNVGDAVAFDLLFDHSGRLRASNITAADGSLLQGSDDPITEYEKRFLNQQIRTEILKVDFEEEHYKRYMHHDGMTRPSKGSVIRWDEKNGEGTISDDHGVDHYFQIVDVAFDDGDADTRIRVGDSVEFGSMDIDGAEMKRAVDIHICNSRCVNKDIDENLNPNMSTLLEKRYSGECTKWGEGSSYGFIRSSSLAKQVFAHYTAIEKSEGAKKCLFVGEKVEFDLKTSSDGRKHAANVTGLGGKPVLGRD